jgi:endonuclease-8
VPEGHVIRRLADRHTALLAGDRLQVRSPQGRFAAGAAVLCGHLLDAVEPAGKHLLYRFAGLPGVLHVHLGLYGRCTDGAVPAPAPVGEVRLRLAGARHWVDLRGPAACEILDPPAVEALLARLGADPLRGDADPGAAYARVARSDKPLTALLQDQSIVAGTGLIYVTEVLFRAGLSPATPGRRLTRAAWESIWTDLCALMPEGVRTGRIDTVHAAHTPEAMGRAPRVDRHGGEVYVYRRAGQPCLICGTPVRTGVLAGRNAYWCPTCQRPPRRRPGGTTSSGGRVRYRPGRSSRG